MKSDSVNLLGGDLKLDPLESNKLIRYAIATKTPFMAGKIGESEARVLRDLMVGVFTNESALSLTLNAGIYPLKHDLINWWVNQYRSAIAGFDLVLKWQSAGSYESLLINSLCKKSYVASEFSAVEPFLLGSEGWHYSLGNVSVCVVHPMARTIRSQLAVFDRLWPGASIGKLSLVQYPYQPGVDPHSVFSDSRRVFNEVTKALDSIQFDVLVVGAGGLSLPICLYGKRKGAVSIHLGGGVQLLFGITGRRWDERMGTDWSGLRFYRSNEFWKAPLVEDIPKRATLVEGGCYW